MIKFPVFKKNKHSYLYNNLSFPSLNESKNCKIFMGFAPPSRPRNCIWNKPHLFAYTSLCSVFSLYAMIFSQSLMNADFYNSGIGLDILINVFEDCILSFIWLIRATWVLFSFYLQQMHRFSVWSLTENACFISFHR